MNVDKGEAVKSQIELNIELAREEFKPYIDKGVREISKGLKIEGFRPGHAPYEVVKQKVGEMAILEEAARQAINATLGNVINDHIEGQAVGQPQVEITKLAPDNPLGYKAVVSLLPEVTLSEYKGLKIKSKEAKVDDKEVEKMLSELLAMRAQEAAVLREVKDGDKVLVDLQMFLDKVPLEGGQSRDTAVIIGQEHIVPGFDKQLLGLNKGESREFTLPYPKDFHMQNLAGKLVEFKVTIKDIFERKLPEPNDEFAAGFGAKNAAELKENIKKSLAEHKADELKKQAEREMFDKLLEKARFGDIPEILIQSETDNMLHELEHSVASQGGQFEDYLASIKKSREELALDLMPDAVKRVKVSLLIREIAEAEQITAKEEEVEKQLSGAKEAHKDNKETLERLDSPEYKAYLANQLKSRMVVDKLGEWNIVK